MSGGAHGGASGGLLGDAAARRAALTERNRPVWVEAGAGTGKTALMAGRVALLLAEGVEPRAIAAITFTERAAAELADRIHRFVHALLAQQVPLELEVALPNGLNPDARDRLEAAADRLPELTATTIHGFALDLLRPWPVEANLDPGAVPMDEGEAELAWEDAQHDWLYERLGTAETEEEDDVVAVLARDKGAKVTTTVRELAEDHADDLDVAAAERSEDALPRALDPFLLEVRHALAAVDGLEGALTPEESERFPTLAAFADRLANLCARPTALAVAITHQRPHGPFTQAGTPRKRLATKGRLEPAGRAAGRPTAYDELTAAWTRAQEAHAALDAAAADHLAAGLRQAAQELRRRYDEHKRAAARFDFDDMLRHTLRLLRERPEVRTATAHRYQHVLVDEFQDTDPLQAEIVWRVTGVPPQGGTDAARPSSERTCDWRAWPAAGGARFVVGDPKQSIYRFRRADIATYRALRDAHVAAGDPVLQVSVNFRSRPGILQAVNRAFQGPLSTPEQPGYQALSAHRRDPAGPALVRLPVATPAAAHGAAPDGVDDLRDAEATAVADLVAAMVLKDPDAPLAGVRPNDVALLAPVGTELWRYERALERRGLPVASQAGKDFYRRQEVQDLIALARALADPRDALALGALLRGPLIGASDEQLLDATEALHAAAAGDAARTTRLTLAAELEPLPDGPVRWALARLAPLAGTAHARSPYRTLTDAVAALQVRARLRERHRGHDARAAANLDRFLRSALPYASRGLVAFARDRFLAWLDRNPREREGTPDARDGAVTLVTVHSAKGLEWRVVIPINRVGAPQPPSPPFLGPDGRLHLRVGKALSAGFAAAQAREEQEQQLERVRLAYVAVTRAADLLVLPDHETPLPDACWARIAPLDASQAPAVTPSRAAIRPPAAPDDEAQDAETFRAEGQRIAAVAPRIRWHAPSRADAEATDPPAEREPALAEATDSLADASDAASPSGHGLLRGRVLHLLMEALVNDETQLDDLDDFAREVCEALAPGARAGVQAPTVVPEEVATAARRAWTAPGIADVRDRLIAEVPVYGRADVDAAGAGAEQEADDGGKRPRLELASGVVDAVARSADGTPEVILDWKSDSEPSAATLAAHRAQVRAYLRLTGAAEGRIVYFASGLTVRVEP